MLTLLFDGIAYGMLLFVLAVGLAVSACGGSSDDTGSEGHDHSAGAPAQVEGPDEKFAGFDLAELMEWRERARARYEPQD